MQVSVQSVMNLSDEQRFVLRTIWHPEMGDNFFYNHTLYGPSEIHTFGRCSERLFSENQLNAYPLFTLERMLKLIEDYGGYQMVLEVLSKSSSINEVFPLLWEQVQEILFDGESPNYWRLTIPPVKRATEEIELPMASG
jgi:hypothetical protein